MTKPLDGCHYSLRVTDATVSYQSNTSVTHRLNDMTYSYVMRFVWRESKGLGLLHTQLVAAVNYS